MRVVWRKREWVMVAVFAGRHTLGREFMVRRMAIMDKTWNGAWYCDAVCG